MSDSPESLMSFGMDVVRAVDGHRPVRVGPVVNEGGDAGHRETRLRLTGVERDWPRSGPVRVRPLLNLDSAYIGFQTQIGPTPHL